MRHLLRPCTSSFVRHYHMRNAPPIQSTAEYFNNKSSWTSTPSVGVRASSLYGERIPDAIRRPIVVETLADVRRRQRRGNIAEDTPYARRMTHLSNQIFGESNIKVDEESADLIGKMAERPIKGDPVMDPKQFYAPIPMFHWLFKLLRAHGLYRDEHMDWTEEMQRSRDKRGKPLIKIGEGKRANKR